MNSSILQNKIDGIVQIGNIHYDSLLLGDLSLRLTSEDSVSISKLSLAKDSVKLLEVDSRINPRSNGIFVYLDRLVSFDQSLNIDPEKPIIYQQGNLTFDRYRIKGEWMNILVDGDFNEFELVLNDTDLRQLNYLLPLDSTLIGSGKLDAVIAMVRADSKINLQVNIDSLTIKNSPPMMIKARAETEEDHVPVTFSLNSATNKIQLEGNYFPNRSMIAASLELDINELHIVEVFLKDMLTDIDGQITGNISIDGNLKAPDLNGVLNFQDVKLTTLKPRSTFLMKDETVYLDNYGISLQNFTIYDQQENPLVVDGNLITRDYKNFEYDLAVKAEDYWLINNPRQEGYQLQGNLVIDSDLKISGAPDQTAISANLKVKDTTALTYIMPQQELELISGDGIVEFVDPENPDTVSIPTVQGVYDSLIASLPELSIESTLQLEKDALLEVVVDANSGDYIQVKGTADLKFEMDHTKNMELTGTYTMNEGFYQLSFYDLVKKRFLIKPESTVTWNGDPKNGDLDIVAFYTIKTSSLGLIGHEIGENEKGLYRRALPYEVGINIRGNLENPQISFSLDLPVNDKANYPVLSNKLGRLLQPEYEAELNRQVFGLLVLGGFIPESGAGEVNENLIATTALSNSVNAILASQLNRFAGQLVPGVDINVGLQSYSDFSTGSGNTRTAMDFKVSKRLMDDRLSIEVGGGMDINANGSESYAGSDSFRGDVVVIYDLTESGNKQLKIFNNETYDIVYHEIRNTGVSLIFIREFDKEEENN
ncbi:MAG: hypothetical protein DHS20C17_31740 [Cyclobacteriaceae bacterium]|nr:MAG: hypothetical protein DHS20C17_31740 [Cyclobacteriaceae bacterium]